MSRPLLVATCLLAAALAGAVTLVVVRRSGGERELEPSIAARATPSGVAWVTAFMQVERGASAAASLGVRASTERATLDVRAPGGRYSADPTIALEAGGAARLTWLAFRTNRDGDAHDMVVLTARRAEGDLAFGAPRELLEAHGGTEYDRPTSALTGDDRLLVAVRTAAAGRAAIELLRADGGPPVRRVLAEGAGFLGGLPALCVGTRAHVAWFDPIAGVRTVAVSVDDLAPGPVRAVSRDGEDVALEAPLCAARGDEVWLAYGVSALPLDTGASAAMSSLVLVHSSDGGATFDRRVTVADDGNVLVHPQLAWEDDGVSVVAYAAPLVSGAAALRHLRVGRDGKVDAHTLRAPLELSRKRADPGWIGDYFGLTGAGGALFVAFGDNAGHPPRVEITRVR